MDAQQPQEGGVAVEQVALGDCPEGEGGVALSTGPPMH